jgi:hypothetical protein
LHCTNNALSVPETRGIERRYKVAFAALVEAAPILGRAAFLRVQFKPIHEIFPTKNTKTPGRRYVTPLPGFSAIAIQRFGLRI